MVAIDGTGSSTARASAPIVEVEGLGRSFGDFVAVSGITLDVPRGTILGIIGPSGSGKTTTIRMITGSLRPTDGKVVVFGERPDHFQRLTRERIGYMPQRFILYPDLTVGENVDFVATLFGLLFFRRRRRVREVLRLVELWDFRKRRAKDLSGGMQRRLELACALVHEPDLLVLDEPTAGIDPILRRVVWDELHRLRERGVTALVTTQYVTEAEECDGVALISEGRLIALASPEDLRRQALGGDIIEVTTKATFDAASLRALDSVRAVRQLGLRDFRVVVTEAGVATPEVVDAITSSGGEVEAAREVHPTFEEVFALLVERDRVEHGDVRGDASAEDGAPRQTRPIASAGDRQARREADETVAPTDADYDRMDSRWAEPSGRDGASKTLEAAEDVAAGDRTVKTPVDVQQTAPATPPDVAGGEGGSDEEVVGGTR